MKQWQRELRVEIRRIERDITNLRKENEKLQKDVQALVNRGDTGSAQCVATQLVRGREAVERLEKTKLSMTSAFMALTTQMGTAQNVGALKRSTSAMHHMNGAIRGHEMPKVVKCMQQEMDSHHMTHEVVDDAFQNFHLDDHEMFLRDYEVAKAAGGAQLRMDFIGGSHATSFMSRINRLDNASCQPSFGQWLGTSKDENWDDNDASLMDRINNL
jgi:hypothetical protein